MKRSYAYFAGCSAKGTCRELDISTAAVSDLFGIELIALENAGCTGAREFRTISEQLHLTANGRIIAMAEALGHDLVVVCDTCLLNLVEANNRLRTDAAAREMVNRTLAEERLEFKGTIDVKHFLWVLTGDLGEAGLRAKIVRPLHGLRVAPFYGCHIQKPVSALGEAHGNGKPALDGLCEILGAQVVQYAGANKCCGFHVVTTAENVALQMSASHLDDAAAQSAHCIVTPCPLCHTVLDGYQPDMKRKQPSDLPILHVSQLVGIAVGLTSEDLALSRHVIGCADLMTHLADGKHAASLDR